MPDLLCPLFDLPPLAPALDRCKEHGVSIRRTHPWERAALEAWILKHFTRTWADESLISFSHQPVTSFIAHRHDDYKPGNPTIMGFSCYECSRKNYFGPTGVDEATRGQGIGKALFLAALYGLQELGYSYAIIGGAGPVEFYQKTVGAMVIPFNDGRGIYDIMEEPGLRR